MPVADLCHTQIERGRAQLAGDFVDCERRAQGVVEILAQNGILVRRYGVDDAMGITGRRRTDEIHHIDRRTSLAEPHDFLPER